LRRGLIPWLAGIDPETGNPRRRTSRIADIPQESVPLIRLLLDQRLLTSDRTVEDGKANGSEATIELTHEAVLRQWNDLREWLKEDQESLVQFESVNRAARDWAANDHRDEWLNHSGRRLKEAESTAQRYQLFSNLASGTHHYLDQCRRLENGKI